MFALPLWQGASRASNLQSPRRPGCRRMSRAVNVDATVDEVVALAATHKAAISAIEPLHPRGTRVVFMNGKAAAAFSRACRSRLITEPVTRTPWRQQRVS